MKALARIAVLALVCLWMPLAAAAPPLTTVHRIGFLWNSSPSFTHHLLEAFRHGLHERGYVEGTHFTIESRYAEGDPTRLPGLAAELVGLPVAVIVTAGSQAIQAVKQATSTIPVVIAASSDPVETGFVTSLARPGENLTGLSLSAPELSGKRLELLKAVPAIAHVAVLANPANPNTAAQMRETQRAAQALQVQLHLVEVRGPQELDSAFSAIRSVPADALRAPGSAVYTTARASGRADGHEPTAGDVWLSGGCRDGGTDGLWPELSGPVPACRHLRRQDSEGAKPATCPWSSRRSTSSPQPQDRQSAWHHAAPNPPDPGRRGDAVSFQSGPHADARSVGNLEAYNSVPTPAALAPGRAAQRGRQWGEQVGSFQRPALSHTRVSIILARQECLGLLLGESTPMVMKQRVGRVPWIETQTTRPAVPCGVC